MYVDIYIYYYVIFMVLQIHVVQVEIADIQNLMSSVYFKLVHHSQPLPSRPTNGGSVV